MDFSLLTSAILRRRVADLFTGLGHQLLEALAGLGPGLVAQRNGTIALALAVVLAGVLAAAALSFAVIHAVAIMERHGGTATLARAFVGGAGFPFVLASIDAATDMGVIEQKAGRVAGGLDVASGSIFVAATAERAAD